MKIKIFKILCALLFFIIFGYFFGDEYWEYAEKGKQETQYQEYINSEISDFSTENIGTFGNEIELYYTPYLGLLDTIVDEIDAAKERIYVEVYIFTETNMRDAIIRAYKRGVDVKILLENNPYKAPHLNDKHYNAFKDAGIDVRWSDPLNYSLNHSKLLIVDDRAYISTGNFSYSLFKYNRDFILELSDEDFIGTLEKLFLQDFHHEKIGIYHENLVLSPEYSRNKISSLVAGAQNNIKFYFPYIADEEFKNVLFDSAKNGISIRGIVEEKTHKEDANVIEDFRKNNIEIHPLLGDKLHAKAILVDDTYLYIGSINFSRYSFDENREIGIIVKDQKIIQKFIEIFESDF